MRRVGAVMVAMTFVLVHAPSALAGSPGCAHATSSGPCLHWARTTSSSREIRVVVSLTTDWETAVKSRARKWSKGSSAFDLNIEAGSTDASVRRACARIDGKIHVCSYPFGNTGWAGLTNWWYNSNGHLVAVTVRLNDTTTPESARRAVACHELGHSVGLAHRSQSETGTPANPGTCLTPQVNSFQTLPDATDFSHLDQIYNHTDASGSSPTSMVTQVVTAHRDLPPLPSL